MAAGLADNGAILIFAGFLGKPLHFPAWVLIIKGTKNVLPAACLDWSGRKGKKRKKRA